MAVNNVIFNYKEWPFYLCQIIMLERGKQIPLPRDYVFWFIIYSCQTIRLLAYAGQCRYGGGGL